MDKVFLALLLTGILVGLLCVICGPILLLKRYRAKTMEIEIEKFGKIKTTQSGFVLIFFGLFLFICSNWSYSHYATEQQLGGRVDRLIIETAKQLHSEYRLATDSQRPPVPTNVFSRVNLLIGVIQTLDSENGYALYYAGAVKWAEGKRDEAEDNFYRYLDIEETMPASETGGDTGIKVCYERPRGFCPQRTAWIHHLLANKLYSDAISETNLPNRKFLLSRALTHAKRAFEKYPGGFGGTGQCIATEALTNEIAVAISELK